MHSVAFGHIVDSSASGLACHAPSRAGAEMARRLSSTSSRSGTTRLDLIVGHDIHKEALVYILVQPGGATTSRCRSRCRSPYDRRQRKVRIKCLKKLTNHVPQEVFFSEMGATHSHRRRNSLADSQLNQPDLLYPLVGRERVEADFSFQRAVCALRNTAHAITTILRFNPIRCH